ncbi:hypothetical protein [uncultured Spongiibacter sp.]|uniref:GFA family protein n=1 Tax=uncultured Spongiibacter sp. TaxID=870896 RepID=UPI0025985177|nr:hypothetical protein [uncultured Spongiibacter sp.]
MAGPHALSGRCHCGDIAVSMQLSGAAERYSPRACDCDFCRLHGASYLSDPKGQLRFTVQSGAVLNRYRQGAEEADMLLCGRCGVLVGACYEREGERYGVVNAAVLPPLFAAPQPVSPKQLSADEKVARWQQLWFACVMIDGA